MSEGHAAIEASRITVKYGRKTAVAGVTLSIPNGSVYALLGRNGSGKSSLVRALLGQLHPESGEARMFGLRVWEERKRLMDRIGVVPEESDLPAGMRVRELASFSARLYSRWNARGFDERIARFGIDPRMRAGDLSKGQKRQVALALALASSPELLILDDPTLGLDVVARKALFEEVIADLAERGITVLITTHDLSGVEAIADRVGILQNGLLLLDEETEALKARFRRIRVAAPAMSLAQADLVAARVTGWGNGTEAIVSNYDDLQMARLHSGGQHAEVSPMSLEEIFIAVAGEERSAS